MVSSLCGNIITLYHSPLFTPVHRYDLICLDRGHNGYGGNVGDEWVTVGSDGTLEANACFASGWYDKLHGYISKFINETGLSMLETDGPYVFMFNHDCLPMMFMFTPLVTCVSWTLFSL